MAVEQIRRYCGFVADPTLGGTSRDNLTATPPLASTSAPTLPAPTTWFPVTEVSLDKGVKLIDRKDEMRGLRGDTPSASFQAAPKVTVKGRLYPYVAKKLMVLTTGGTDTPTGASPAAVTHTLNPVSYGPAFLPAVTIHLQRDDLQEAVVGCQLNELKLSFPNNGEATYEADFVGLYYTQDSNTLPAMDLSAVVPDWVYQLRDTQLLADGTAVQDLKSFDLTINNNMRAPDFEPMLNREDQTIGGVDHRVWFPNTIRLGSSLDVNGKIGFLFAKPEEDVYHTFAATRQFQIAVEAEDLSTTPPAREMFITNIAKGFYTSSKIDAMKRADDVTSEFDFEAGIDSATGNFASFEFVDASSTPLTF